MKQGKMRKLLIEGYRKSEKEDCLVARDWQATLNEGIGLVSINETAEIISDKELLKGLKKGSQEARIKQGKFVD